MAARGATPRYKAVLLGDAGVGKSKLFETVKNLKETGGRGHETATPLKYSSGTSIEMSYKVYVEGDGVLFSLWDTGGVERFRTITKNYYKGTKVFIYVYSKHIKDSLDTLISFIKEGNLQSPDALRVLVGNTHSSPDTDARAVAEEDIISFSHQHGIASTLRFQMSLDSSDDVFQLFQTIAEHLIEGYHNPTFSHDTIELGPNPLDPGCCNCS